MNRLKYILNLTGFHRILQIFFFLLFVWPFLVIKNNTHNHFIFYWLYGSWLSIIIIHFIMDVATKKE